MNEIAGAEIIPFPQRHSSGDLAQSTARLAESLANLSAALSEQKEALVRWRDALSNLSTKMQDIAPRTH